MPPLGVQGDVVFDAAVLGADCGKIAAPRRFQYLLAHAGLGGDDGDYVDHFELLLSRM